MTPIERAARALFDMDSGISHERGEETNWLRLNDQMTRDKYIKEARAVLTAIREPSEAMDDAGSRAGDLIYEPGCNATEAWQAMIDAALGEVQP